MFESFLHCYYYCHYGLYFLFQEVTENDRKNVFMLKMLLVFSNQISRPIFLPRNRVGGAKRPKSNYGFKDCSSVVNDIYVEFSATQEKVYDYYDEWNFREAPKRINHSVGQTSRQVVSSQKSSTHKNIGYNPNGHVTSIDHSNSNTGTIVQIASHLNILDTFDYDIKEEYVEDMKILDTEAMDLTNVNLEADTSILLNMYDKNSIENTQYGTQFEGTLTNIVEEINHNANNIALPYEPRKSDDVEINNISTHEVLFETLRILDDDNYGQMEMSDENISVENDSFGVESSRIPEVANNVNFNLQEMKLVYGILGYANDLEAVVPELDSTKVNVKEVDNFVRNMDTDSPMKSLSQDDIVPDVSEINEENNPMYFDNSELYDDMEGSIDHEFDDIKTHMSQNDVDIFQMKQRNPNVQKCDGSNTFSQVYDEVDMISNRDYDIKSNMTQINQEVLQITHLSLDEMNNEERNGQYSSVCDEIMLPLNNVIVDNSKMNLTDAKGKSIPVIVPIIDKSDFDESLNFSAENGQIMSIKKEYEIEMKDFIEDMTASETQTNQYDFDKNNTSVDFVVENNNSL